MNNNKAIEVGRAINGIGLNGNEWLLTKDRKNVMQFKDKQCAIDFLKDWGYDGFSSDDFEDNFVFQEVEKR